MHGFVVPEEDRARFGLETGMVKRVPRLGEGYVAESDGLHHLHCLDLLRLTSYFNYEYYCRLGKGAFENNDHILELHVGKISVNCISIC